MYHYVREFSDDIPFLRFLHLNDFKKQLDIFQKQYNFPSKAEIQAYFGGDTAAIPSDKPNMLLTFDDGLADHYHYVLPELKRRGLWGIFYINSGPYEEALGEKLVGVHEIHLLLGRYGGERVLARAQDIIKSEWVSESLVSEFEEITYTMQKNTAATTQVKKLLNYFLKPEHREQVLYDLMADFFPDGSAAIAKSWYMTQKQLQSMHEAGMWLGAHSRTHPVIGTLDPEEQANQILECFTVLESLLQPAEAPLRTFAYPYGGKGSYSPVTFKANL